MSDEDEVLNDAVRKKIDKTIQQVKDSAEEQIKAKLKGVEDEFGTDFRNKLLALAGAIVLIAAAVSVLGSLNATKEVKTAVINLQSDIIAAHNTIKEADQELTAAAKAANDARNDLTKAKTEMQTQAGEALQKLRDTAEQLAKAKADYDQLRELLEEMKVALTPSTNSRLPKALSP